MKSVTTLTILSWLVCANPAAAQQELPKSSLGNLAVDYRVVESVARRPGPRVLMEARELPGAAFSVRLPFEANRFVRTVPQGSEVATGQVIAEVEGPELAAWTVRAQGVTERFAAAQRRYTESEVLYRQQSLAASKWADIADAYHALAVQMHQVEHTREILTMLDTHRAELRAPRPGRVRFLSAPGDGAEIEVAEILPAGGLRLTGLISRRSETAPDRLRVGDCAVTIAVVEERTEGLSRRVWSDALPPCAPRTPGALIDGRFEFPFAGYAVPRASIATVGGQAGLFVDRGAVLEFVPVTIASTDARHVFVRAEGSLEGVQVLTTSVSAAQGLLLGLGQD